MAIEKENIAYAGTAARVNVPNAQAAPAASGWGFLSLTSLGGISRTPSSEALSKASTVMIEAIQKLTINPKFELHLLKVDNTTEIALRLSSLVMTVLRRDLNKLSYHTILLEASADPMPPRIETYNGQQVPVDRFASDVYDPRYMQAVAGVISAAFPGFQAKECSGVVCPRSFNWDDKDLVRQFINNTILPCVSDLETREAGFYDIDLSKWNKGEQLVAQVGFNENTRSDYTGLPIRNDIVVTLSATSIERQDPTTLNNQERNYVVAQLGGFIDLLWAPVENYNPYGQPGQVPNQKFGARFVMTSLENQLRMTVPSQLLALASALTLGEGTNWYPYYGQRVVSTGGRNVDTRDIGAINIEANMFNDPSGFGAKIDTKTSTFNQLELGRLIQMAIRPGITYSLDVSSCGSDTWYNEVFPAAASGNPGAIKAIIDAADTLTGGNFKRHYPDGRSPVLINDDRILMGHYVGQDGQRHDVRDIDYLAILNYAGERDHLAPQAWSDTFQRLEYPIYKRLDARKRIICDAIGTEVTFTQTAQRVTYDAEFIKAFAMACRDAGLTMKLINPALNGEYVNNRGTAGWLAQSNVANTMSGMFTSGFNSVQAAAAQRHYANRW